MEKKGLKENIIKTLIKIMVFVICFLIYCGLLIIIELHKCVPFFPVLFLFHIIFWAGHPLFVIYVLKRKWGDCTKNNYLLLKYILIPCIILELLVMLYYPNETWLILQQVVKG